MSRRTPPTSPTCSPPTCTYSHIDYIPWCRSANGAVSATFIFTITMPITQHFETTEQKGWAISCFGGFLVTVQVNTKQLSWLKTISQTGLNTVCCFVTIWANFLSESGTQLVTWVRDDGGLSTWPQNQVAQVASHHARNRAIVNSSRFRISGIRTHSEAIVPTIMLPMLSSNPGQVKSVTYKFILVAS